MANNGSIQNAGQTGFNSENSAMPLTPSYDAKDKVSGLVHTGLHEAWNYTSGGAHGMANMLSGIWGSVWHNPFTRGSMFRGLYDMAGNTGVNQWHAIYEGAHGHWKNALSSEIQAIPLYMPLNHMARAFVQTMHNKGLSYALGQTVGSLAPALIAGAVTGGAADVGIGAAEAGTIAAEAGTAAADTAGTAGEFSSLSDLAAAAKGTTAPSLSGTSTIENIAARDAAESAARITPPENVAESALSSSSSAKAGGNIGQFLAMYASHLVGHFRNKCHL